MNKRPRSEGRRNSAVIPNQSTMSSVRVAVRVRPLNQREVDLNSHVVVSMHGKVVRIVNPKTQDPSTFHVSPDSPVSRSSDHHGAQSPGSADVKEFPFHYCFWSCEKDDEHFVGQEVVYKHMGEDVVKAAFDGYNACVFAYGQTGSGKTYSMMGREEDPGLIPRICKSLFDGMVSSDAVTYRTEVSYLEIYNERVHDLLKSDSRSASHSGNNGSTSLRVREHPKNGPYVQGLSRHIANNCSDVLELMEKGNLLRTTASTNMNDSSSRSHAIFTILFTQANFSKEQPEEKYSKIHLVDLAGSERACATGATGHRLKEGANINKSLVLLGNVISTLAEKSTNRKVTFVPYRDSVLTWLLKDSLGGNSKTMMIATVSPAACNYSETLSTLRYASRAKCIINRPEVNEDPNVKVIRELRDEIQRLRALLESQQSSERSGNSTEGVVERLQASEARVAILTQAWTGRWSEMVSVLEGGGELDLRRHESGISGIVLDSKLPYLVAINTDELSTGISLFHLKEGTTKVGSDKASQDIVLSGETVLSHHCVIVTADPRESEEASESSLTRSLNSADGGARLLHTVTLRPTEDALCTINGVRVEEEVRLVHGCILQFGNCDMFRFNNPAEARKMRKEGVPKQGLALAFRNSNWLNGSMCELNKSDVSFHPSVENDLDSGINGKSSGLNSESCSEEKLVEKRRELAEMEDRLYEAETRWRREAQEKEAELEAKRKRLEELHSNLEESRSRVTTETKKARRVSIDMERYRSCHSPAELFAQMQSDLDEKYNSILDSEIARLSAESKDLDEQKVREDQELAKEEALMKAALNKKQIERDGSAAEVTRLREDVHTLSQMLERGELAREDYDEYSDAVAAELQDQLALLEEQNRAVERVTVANQAGLQAMAERRRVAAQDHADARRDLEIREAAMRRDLSRRMNEELATLVEELVRNSGGRGETPSSPNTRDDTDGGPQNIEPSGKENAENELMSLTMQVRAAEESLRAEERFLEDKEEQVEIKRFRLQELEESHRLSKEVEEEVRRRHAEEARQRAKREEQEREEAKQRELEQMRKQHAMEIAELRRRLEPHTMSYALPRSGSASSDDGFLPPSFRSLSSLRSARSMMNLRPGPSPDLGDRPRNVEVSVTGYLMRSSFVEYEIKITVGQDVWTVCRRYSIIREFHDELRKTYPEIREIAFPPRTMIWSSVERVAQSRVVLFEKYFRHLIHYLQHHQYCILNPKKSRLPLCRRIVCQVLPILRKGEFDNTRFTTA